MLHDILEDDHIQWNPPLIRHYTNIDPVTDLSLITEQKQKYRGMFETQKSGNNSSWGDIGLNIRM